MTTDEEVFKTNFDPILIATEVAESTLMQEFMDIQVQMQGFKTSFTSQEITDLALAANGKPNDVELMSLLADRSNFDYDDIEALSSRLLSISEQLEAQYGEAIRYFYNDSALKEIYQNTLSSKNPYRPSIQKSTEYPCGIGYDLSCDGTRECFYANNLDQFMQQCEERALDVAWYIFEGSVITGTTLGGLTGSGFAGVGAAPGAAIGAGVGLFVGLIGSQVQYAHLLSECRNSLADLCNGCIARCDEP